MISMILFNSKIVDCKVFFKKGNYLFNNKSVRQNQSQEHLTTEDFMKKVTNWVATKSSSSAGALATGRNYSKKIGSVKSSLSRAL
jgi:hypothetical protein